MKRSTVRGVLRSYCARSSGRAHGLAMQVLEITDAAGPHDNPQLVKKPLRSAALACGQIQRALLGPGGNHRQRRRLDRWAVSEDVGRGESGMGSRYSSPERAVLGVPTIDREDRWGPA